MRLHIRWWDLKAERILNLGESFRLESFMCSNWEAHSCRATCSSARKNVLQPSLQIGADSCLEKAYFYII